jgi:hypothetical protein
LVRHIFGERISLILTLIHVVLSITASLLTLFALELQDPAILQIRVLEGEGAVYRIGSRATRGVTLQVTDETGKPVEGVRVSFRLPETGPTGTFSTGAHTEIASTSSDGRAGVWGMQWSRTAGSFEVRITAEKGQTRAGTVCLQYLTDSPETTAQSGKIGPNRNHKWLWIVAGVAGAAAAGVAATASKSKPVPATPTIGVTIGSPSIIIGRP